MAIFPVYKYLQYNGPGAGLEHINSSQEFVSGDHHLIDEMELYRLCDTEMQEFLVSGVSGGGLLYYESVSGTDDAVDIVSFPEPIEAFDRLCEAAYGTPFRGNPDRFIPGLKQFETFESQRAIEESFPLIQSTNGTSGMTTVETISRNIIFDSPIVQVSGVANGEDPNTVRVIVDPSLSSLGKEASYQFFNNGANIKDKWLDHEGSNIPSDGTPGVIPNKSEVRFITYTNIRDRSNIIIEIYRNGIAPANLVFSWAIEDCRYAWLSGVNVVMETFESGDTIQVYARGSPGTSPSKAVIKIAMLTVEDQDTMGCIATF